MKKEAQLNSMYSDSFSENQIVDMFMYLTNPVRGKTTTESYIRKCYRNRTLGTLLKRLDPIAFQVS